MNAMSFHHFVVPNYNFKRENGKFEERNLDIGLYLLSKINADFVSNMKSLQIHDQSIHK